ncbi:MAG: mechanosensitive ion channel family protein [Candidatus Tantalella remota]|nr:mechanosensitive ion channel family protein [Candidatus Tantalella remota]
MSNLRIWGMDVPAAIYIPVLYFLWVSVFLILKRVVFGAIKRFATKTAFRFDDVLMHALDLPLLLFVFVSGIAVLDNIFQFGTDGELLVMVDIVFKATTIIAIIIFFDRLFTGLVKTYSENIPALRDSKGVIQIILRAVVMGLGLLILLDNFGVSLTPILASLGVGSLAVALALQPTLENFFSGMQLIIDKPIKIGQFIKLDSGEEGYVEKIGWRSTWVRMLLNNTVVIPNNVLVNSRVLNYYYPETEISIKIQAGVHYDSDLDHVEKVVVEVAKDVLENVEGGVKDFEPNVRFHTFNDSSIDFRVLLRAQEFTDSYLLKHEFIKRLHKRFKEEDIVIPYPIRTLDWNPGSDPVKIQK